jgi:hypothetical protein
MSDKMDDLRKRVERELPHHMAFSTAAVLIHDLWAWGQEQQKLIDRLRAEIELVSK